MPATINGCLWFSTPEPIDNNNNSHKHKRCKQQAELGAPIKCSYAVIVRSNAALQHAIVWRCGGTNLHSPQTNAATTTTKQHWVRATMATHSSLNNGGECMANSINTFMGIWRVWQVTRKSKFSNGRKVFGFVARCWCCKGGVTFL